MATERRVVNIAPTALAANTTATIGLLEASDTPVHTITSDGTNIADTYPNSYFWTKGLQLHIAAAGSPGDPIPVAVLLWKDAGYGQITDPTTAEDVVGVRDTPQESMLAKNTCMYRKFYLTTRGDQRVFFLKIPKRLRIMKDAESLKLTITNLEGATDSIEYFLQGQIMCRHP